MMGDSEDTSKVLDLSAPDEAQAASGKPAGKRKIQLVKSDGLFHVLAQIIDANLKEEEGSLNFGPVLKGAGQKGKGSAAERILEYIGTSTHPLFQGKTTTAQTLKIWIEE
jgi:hypothetical protein